MSFGDENAPKPSGFHATLVVADCKRCGRSFDDAAWLELELVGHQADGAGAIMELRNCDCGSTHGREFDVLEPEGMSVVLEAVERLMIPGRRIVLCCEEDGTRGIVVEGDRGVVEARCSTRGLLAEQLLEIVEALPPPRDERAALLERLVNDSEPLHSAERDVRPQGTR